MANWPPSPLVEDEATALAKEHGVDAMHAKLVEDHSIPSRGSPDQMPVIVDSDTDTSGLPKATSSTAQQSSESKRGTNTAKSCTFQPETGLPTPPSSDTEVRGRPSSIKGSSISAPSHTERSKSTGDKGAIDTSRPSISRIHTDIDGDLQRAKSGSRRAPSPYSYTREAGTFKVDAGRYTNETYLSPTNIDHNSTSSRSPRGQNTKPQIYDSSTNSERRPKKSLRFAEDPQGPTNSAKVAPQPDPEPLDRTERECQQRQHQKDRNTTHKTFELNDQASTRVSRSRSRQRRTASRERTSPESSSGESGTAGERTRNAKKTSSDGKPVPRRSSHKNERPRLEQHFSQHTSNQPQPNVLEDDTTRRIYRVRDPRDLMTPPTITTPHQQEDYFSKAFHDNAQRTSKYTPRSSVEESVVYSAPNSPPRTPRGEKPAYRYEYVASPTSSPPRTPRHSRPPSVDDTHLKEVKTHTSLLSQATSTASAAALARKASPQSAQSIANAIETTFACTSSGLPSKPRSRASSPQRERLNRSDTFTYGDQPMARVIYPPVPQAHRPSTRDGPSQPEVPCVAAFNQPQRHASYSGYDPQYVVHVATSDPTQPNAAKNPATQSSVRHAPPLQRSQTANAPQDVTRVGREYTLPVCPRAQPTQGHRDWTTFRDMQDLDICPTCTNAVSFTRYRPMLMRSLDKPYDKATTCALSRPWLREAFVQSINLYKSDLSMLQKVLSLPAGARACEGARPDVRTWWKLTDPSTDRAVPDFFACSACVYNVHQVFPDLPEQFVRDTLDQEKTCSLHHGSRHFNTIMRQLDEIAERCRHSPKSHPRYMQPFVELTRRITRYPACAKDMLLTDRPWHFMNDLPEFTICAECFNEVVWPVSNKPVARDIAKTLRLVPQVVTGRSSDTPTVGCQLYSERMRRMFSDLVLGRLSYDTFKQTVIHRHATQHRLYQMNKLFEEDQKRNGFDRRADIEKNKLYWKSLE